MYYALVKFIVLAAFLFGAIKFTRESKHLTRHYRHLQDSVLNAMIEHRKFDPIKYQTTVDSLHLFELIKHGYAKPQTK